MKSFFYYISSFQYIKTLLIVFVLFSFLSCNNKNPEPIKIGTNLWVGYEPLYLARHLNYFNSNEYKLFDLESATDVIRALENGMLDAACLTLDESYLLLQDNINLKILFIMDISNGADKIIAKSEIKTLNELKGKKIGVENTALGAYMLTRGLEFSDLKASDLKILPIVQSSHLEVYNSGKIDALVSFDPVASNLISKGSNLLFDSKQIPNEIFDVFIVRSEVYEKRKEEFIKLKNIWFKSLDYLNSNKDEVASFIAKRQWSNKENIIESLNGIKIPNEIESNNILSNEFLNSANKIEEIMINKKLLYKRVNPAQLLIK